MALQENDMLKIKVKGKVVDVNNYASFANYLQGNEGERLYINYQLNLEKKDAKLFFAGEEVSIPSVGGLPELTLTVKSVTRLSDGNFCVELQHSQTNEKPAKQISEDKKSNCEEEHECKHTCCDRKKDVIKDEKSVDSIQSMVENVLSQEDLNRLPKHFIGIFSDGKKDTVAFELKEGKMKGIGVSHCHDIDTFDFSVGADLAYARLTGCDCGGNCDGCDQEDNIWLHDDDDTPVLDTTGQPIKLGDYVVGYKKGQYVPGVIGHSNGKFYLCNEQGPAMELREFTDFDLVWRA